MDLQILMEAHAGFVMGLSSVLIQAVKLGILPVAAGIVVEATAVMVKVLDLRKITD